MAVVRIKRRCNEEPLDVLLLSSCKRIKTEEEAAPQTSVFKFAATVNKQEDATLHFTHAFKKEAEKRFKKERSRLKMVTDKLREENKLFSDKNRYKVVNCFRALDESEFLTIDSEAKQSNSAGFTVLDVESDQLTDAKDVEPLSKDSKEGYVYDLYYTDAGADLSDLQMDHELSVFPMDSDLVSDVYRDMKDDGCSDEMDEDDDSNDEDNWRNDYPEEEESSEAEETFICARMRKTKIGGDDSDESDGEVLSSDEENRVYSGDLSPTDLNNFGTSYAKYKAKVRSNDYDSSCSVNSDEST